MASGITLNNGSGGKTVETTELDSGRQVESVQLAIIIDGVAVPITEDNPLPVSVPGGIVGAYGKKGLVRIDLSGAGVVLTAEQAAYHIIVAENAGVPTRTLVFPAVTDDDGVYTRLVRNTGANTVRLSCNGNTYDLAPGASALIDFESTQIIGSINAF